MFQDLRYGARMLLKKPGYTAIAVVTLTLGIGANTAIFSAVNATLLRPLPYQQPERLVFIYEQRIAQGRLQGLIAPGDFFAWQEQNRSFDRMAAYTEALFNLTGDGEPERVWGMITTPELFATLGVRPMLGRDFTAEDGASDAPGVILGHGLWIRRFGAARDVVGNTIQLDGRSYTVLGVMPPGFQFIGKKFEAWRTFNMNAEWRANRRFYYLTAVGRFKPSVTLAEARTEMGAIAMRLEQQSPDTNKGHGVNLVTFDDAAVGRLRPALYALVAAVGFVLLIACVNVASLSLVRASARQREMAVRASVGATRAALVRQLLTESLLLAFTGGAVGLLVATWGVDLLVAAAPSNLPRLDQISVDARALAFTLVVSALTGIASGLLPALQLSRTDLSAGLKDGGHNAAGSRGRSRALNSLVVIEVALALTLLIGAGLLIRSFARLLLEVEPGFASEKVLAIDLSLNGERFNNRRHIFMEQLTARLASLPGVVAVGATTHLPLSGEDGGRSYAVAGDAARSAGEKLVAEYRIVTPDYLRAMKIPLRAGRYFTALDRNEYFTADGRRVEGYANRERGERDAPGVVIINETLARRRFAGGDPLGRRIVIDDGQSREREIVGVVGDVKHFSLEDSAKPELYLPYAQRPTQNQTLVIRTDTEPTALVAAVRGEVRSLDKDLPLYGVKTMEDYLDESVAARRLNMLLVGVFAAVAMLLAAVGIYGVISHSVTERTREIGIRMALGASSQDALTLVLRRGMTLALMGVGLGLTGSAALTWLMKNLLFGVSATDPLTFVVIALSLIFVAFLACLIPAKRAANVDPMIALRCE